MTPRRAFPTTSWTLVLQAAHGERRSVLEELCALYRPPVHAFILGQVRNQEDAEDLTQEFFAVLVEKHTLESVRPDVSRFRSFLLAAVRHFLSNQRDRKRARKRGDGQAALPLDAGTRGAAERLADNLTPEHVFERRWALLQLDRALKAVREKYEHAGQAHQFEMLNGFLTGTGQQPHYARAALELGLGESAVKMAVHRMRRRWGEALRAEVQRTVADPGEVDEEIRYLFSVLSR